MGMTSCPSEEETKARARPYFPLLPQVQGKRSPRSMKRKFGKANLTASDCAGSITLKARLSILLAPLRSVSENLLARAAESLPFPQSRTTEGSLPRGPKVLLNVPLSLALPWYHASVTAQSPPL